MEECPNCGKEIQEDTKYCPHCGTALSPDIMRLKIKLDEYKNGIKEAWYVGGLATVFFITGLLLHYIPPERNINIFKPLSFLILSLVLFIIMTIGSAYYGYKRNKLLKEMDLK